MYRIFLKECSINYLLFGTKSRKPYEVKKKKIKIIIKVFYRRLQYFK